MIYHFDRIVHDIINIPDDYQEMALTEVLKMKKGDIILDKNPKIIHVIDDKLDGKEFCMMFDRGSPYKNYVLFRKK